MVVNEPGDGGYSHKLYPEGNTPAVVSSRPEGKAVLLRDHMKAARRLCGTRFAWLMETQSDSAKESLALLVGV